MDTYIMKEQTQVDSLLLSIEKTILSGPVGARFLKDYKSINSWEVQREVAELLKKNTPDDNLKTSSYDWPDKVKIAYRTTSDNILREIDSRVKDYSLSQATEKPVTLAGGQIARKLISSPVPNAYVVKIGTNYFTLAVLEAESAHELSDFRRVGSYETWKEAILSVKYTYFLAQAQCDAKMRWDIEHGNDNLPRVVRNEYFLTDEEVSLRLRQARETTNEQSYSVVAVRIKGQGFSSCKVVTDEESATGTSYRPKHQEDVKIVAGLSYNKAKAIATDVNNMKRAIYLEQHQLKKIADLQESLNDAIEAKSRYLKARMEADQELEDTLQNLANDTEVIEIVKEVIQNPTLQ